ncbi:PH domain-containing protein [Nocardioides bruguierae]|uniref:PH domain-containing protein n=1 Tax=Nocardioides bruguierae TaxID=2945102 RepID=A0A9X2DCE9_9ACTN|nr:PH domain-containing protein [Nocardioides bruguierae]MCL8024731.1 PH domain-containing protein [Nocardioides bruguierae]MCM0621914.1 PH domain-containing protein [Nocardioides bruguierae]
MGLLTALGDPRISRHLLREEGEVIVDEVTHHWVAYVRPVAEGVLGVALLCTVPFARVEIAWLPLVLFLVLAVRATWGFLSERVDRFVITNMRVFRVHGVLNRQLSTMPLSRILDISVTKPLLGRLLGYGHFVFESAAQEQGLRDIRFVGRPDQRDLTIQRVVQRAGLRGPRV